MDHDHNLDLRVKFIKALNRRDYLSSLVDTAGTPICEWAFLPIKWPRKMKRVLFKWKDGQRLTPRELKRLTRGLRVGH